MGRCCGALQVGALLWVVRRLKQASNARTQCQGSRGRGLWGAQAEAGGWARRWRAGVAAWRGCLPVLPRLTTMQHPVRAQAATNMLLGHFMSLACSLWLLNVVGEGRGDRFQRFFSLDR